MKAAACVRRVGGLAVALGVGAAVVTGYGCGVAWADTPDSSSSESSASSTSAESASTQTDNEKVATATEEPEGSETNDTSTSTGSTTSQAPKGVVVSTGGAKTKSESKKDDATTAPTKIPKAKRESAAATAKKWALGSKVDAVEVKVDTEPRPTVKAAAPQTDAPVSSFVAQRMSSTTELKTATVTPLRPWPTAFSPITAVTYVRGLVSSLVGAVLDPFAAGAPAPPAQPPT